VGRLGVSVVFSRKCPTGCAASSAVTVLWPPVTRCHLLLFLAPPLSLFLVSGSSLPSSPVSCSPSLFLGLLLLVVAIFSCFLLPVSLSWSLVTRCHLLLFLAPHLSFLVCCIFSIAPSGAGLSSLDDCGFGGHACLSDVQIIWCGTRAVVRVGVWVVCGLLGLVRSLLVR
jgi:hypothetical protein